ncbi:MAG: glutamyl-tRNA reductase [Ornithinimicrobium sp.]
MSVIIVGLSHHTAPLEVLERVLAGPDRMMRLRAALAGSADINEFMTIDTCNRVEVLADAERFHGAVRDIANALASGSDIQRSQLTEHLYVHYDERAVHHLFELACGLSSMALGEPQILGQLRTAFLGAQQDGSAGPALNAVVQHALRVGKKAHAQTSLDVVARSLVQIGLDELDSALPVTSERHVLIVGGGAMGALAARTIAEQPVAAMHVISRDLARASILAQRYGGRAGHWDDLGELLGTADLVICCTGSADPVITVDMLRSARGAVSRSVHPRPIGFIDLALPADTDEAVADLPGVYRLGLAQIQSGTQSAFTSSDSVALRAVLEEVADLITAEVAAYLLSRRVHQVAPTVAALRSRAATVVQAELERLDHRTPELDDASRAQLHQTVRRIVDKLLHTPTVRAKEMGGIDQPEDYARVLRELFDLDPEQIVSVDDVAAIRGGDGV